MLVTLSVVMSPPRTLQVTHDTVGVRGVGQQKELR